MPVPSPRMSAVGWSLLGHGLMALVKLALGLGLGSLALLADALTSAAHGMGGISALVAAQLSDPRPDRDHPYGHTKYQAVTVLGIAVLLTWGVLELVQAVVARWLSGQQPLALAAPQALVLLVLFGFDLLLLGQRNPQAWITLGVGLALGASRIWALPWLDGLVALPICGLLLGSCWRDLRQQLPWLVDQIALAPEAIHNVAMGVPGVCNCHDIASRGILGQQVFIDMHMVVDADDLPTAHRITELVEERLEARFGPVRCTIHLEPREYASAAITFKGTHG